MPSLVKQWVWLSTALIGAAAPVTRSAGSGTTYSSIVVFGDSFSDNGDGAYRISNGTWPLVPPYYEGRFSNGLVWPEYLAANLSLPLYDYAVGGATTSNDLVQGFTGPGSTIPVPSVADQIASFLDGTAPTGTSLTSDDDTTTTTPLFVLLAGANDIFFDANISAAQSYLELHRATQTLLAARPSSRVVLIAPPDLARLPYGFYADALTRSQLRAYTDLLASLLASDAARDSAVDAVDLRPLFDDFEYFANPLAYGFDALGKYGSCLVGTYGEGPSGEAGTIEECDDADERVYWDEYHPTTRTHSWIAREILDALS